MHTYTFTYTGNVCIWVFFVSFSRAHTHTHTLYLKATQLASVRSSKSTPVLSVVKYCLFYYCDHTFWPGVSVYLFAFFVCSVKKKENSRIDMICSRSLPSWIQSKRRKITRSLCRISHWNVLLDEADNRKGAVDGWLNSFYYVICVHVCRMPIFVWKLGKSFHESISRLCREIVATVKGFVIEINWYVE